jgi:hypothetical protein
VSAASASGGTEKRNDNTARRRLITSLEPVVPPTGDSENRCTAASSPLSPVSPLEMKNLMKRRVLSKTATSSTGDTGDVARTATSLGVGGGREFSRINPMNQNRVTAQLANIRAAPRCGAKTRAGSPCRCPAIRDRKRCRLHGGHSSGAPKGRDNGNYRDGTFTAEAIQEEQWLRSMVRRYTKKLTKP